MKAKNLVLLVTVILFLTLAVAAQTWPWRGATAQMPFTITTGDGLALTLAADGAATSLRLSDGDELLNAPGGFRLREVTTATVNLAPNPGFELGTTTPLSWTLGTHWTWDASVVHSGSHSIKIVVPPPTDTVSTIARSLNFPLTPDTIYDFSAWARTEGVGGTYTPAIRLVELDAAGNVLRDEQGYWVQHNLSTARGTSDWQHLQMTFITQSDCRQGYIYANIWYGYGTAWFDDVALSNFLGDSPEITLLGTVIPWQGALVQRADVLTASLSFTATYTARSNHIRIDGEIQDTTGHERALQLSFILPMNAVGWIWGDDLRTTRLITTGVRYENTQPLGQGRTFSRYPFASLSHLTPLPPTPSPLSQLWERGEGVPPQAAGVKGEVGLVLAVPMDVPRLQRTSYSSSQGYQITFDLGLSPATTTLGPGRATFSLLLYHFDPAWGFRAAAAKYYAIFPQFFTKRVQREGLWFYSLDLSQLPDPEDFGFTFDESGDSNLVYDNTHGIYTFRYIEPWGWWRDFGTDPTKPSYEARIAALVSDATSGTGTWWGAPITTVAQSVLNSSPLDEASRYYIDADDYFWHPWGPYGDEPVAHYYQNYPTNPDPDIPPPNRGLIARQYEVDGAFQRAAQTHFIDHWTFGEDCAWDTVTHTADHAALVSVPGNADVRSGIWQSEPIAVTSGGSYVLAVWARGQGLGGSGGPGFYAVELGADGQPLQPWTQHGVGVPKGTYDWTWRTIAFTVGPTTTAVYLYGNIWEGYGQVWFDDVELHAAGSVANLARNPGFEGNARGEETDARLDGVYLDSLNATWAWPTLEDYRQDHWAVADQPLVFSYVTRRPVLLGLFANYDFARWLCDDLHASGHLVMANIFPGAYTFYAHLLDELGSEVPDIEEDADASYRRTLSYQKPNSYVMQWHAWGGGEPRAITHEEMAAYIRASLFYGFFPSIAGVGEEAAGAPGTYWEDPAFYERDRDLFRLYMPIIKQIARAGWEPVTYARTDNPAVWVERFGMGFQVPSPRFQFDNMERGTWNLELYFTVHNSLATTTTYTLTMDAAALGLGTTQPFTVTELVSGTIVPCLAASGQVHLSQTIAGSDTRVYQLAGCLLLGDFDRDGDVDVADIMQVASRWRCQCGDACYASRYDLDGDCDIDIVDIMRVAAHWGDTCGGTAASAAPSPGRAKASTQNPAVRLEPANSTVAAGSTFTVTVMIDEAVDLGAFQFDLRYTPSILQVEAVTLGGFLASTGRTAASAGPRIDNGTGLASFAGFSFGTQPGPNGSGALALVRLRAVVAGTSLLDLDKVQVLDTQVNSQAPTVEDGSVTVEGEHKIHLPIILKEYHGQP
jgi:hypothetical protein